MSTAGLTNDQLLQAYLGEIPNRGAAIFALTAYLAVSIALLAVTIKTRGWFMMTAVVTGFLEFGGFLARLFMLKAATSGTTVAMQCLLIISPVLLAIVEYVCVGKLIRLSETARNHRLLRWQAPLFTFFEILTLAFQGGGGGLLSMAQTDVNAAEMGRQLLLAGLGLQLAFFSIFTLLTIWIHEDPKFGYKGNADFRRVFLCLYVTIVLLFVRNIFRVIEFTDGWLGYLATHEVYFYVFDFIPVFSTLVFFTVWHYGWYLPKQPVQAEAGLPVSEPCKPHSPPSAPKIANSAASAPKAAGSAVSAPKGDAVEAPFYTESKSFSAASSSVEDGQVERGVGSDKQAAAGGSGGAGGVGGSGLVHVRPVQPRAQPLEVVSVQGMN